MTDSPRAATDALFPADGPPEAQLQALLSWAVLAPSVFNTQPWRFEIEPDAVCVLADRSRQLQHVDPDGRDLAVSCGAALFNLRLAARHFGFTVDVARTPEASRPDLLARMRLTGSASASGEETDLFRAIKYRQTKRRAFADTPLPDGLIRLF